MFKDMTDDELRRAYVAERTASYNASNLACSVRPRTAGGRTVARQWGRALRNVEIIEAIARQRRIRLLP